MSLATLAAARHVAKHRFANAPASRCDGHQWSKEAADTAVSLVAVFALTGLVLGVVFAEQAGIVWLSVLFQALLFLSLLALALVLIGICLIALAGSV